MAEQGWKYVDKRKVKQKKKFEQNQLQKAENIILTHDIIIRQYKTKKCLKPIRDHNLKTCLKVHTGEQVRRNPFQNVDSKELRYTHQMCPHHESDCHEGIHCTYAHNNLELSYHPVLYKTKMCKSTNCTLQEFCPRAHGVDDVRRNTECYDNVKKQRNISFTEFVQLPKQDASVEVIETIIDWSGWKKKVGSSSLLPCPIEDVESRMLHKYTELKKHVRDVCFEGGCIPFLEITPRNSRHPVSLLVKGSDEDAIVVTNEKIQRYLQTWRCNSAETFPPRFVRYLDNDSDGVQYLKSICTKYNGIDISLNVRQNKVIVFGNISKVRQNTLHELRKLCLNFALSDAKAIADAKLVSLETRLAETQQELQTALQQQYELRKNMQSSEIELQKMLYKEKNVKTTEFPTAWTSNEGYEEVQLEKESPEWCKVYTQFISTLRSIPNVKSITRIESHNLWEHYSLIKKEITIELMLWHGTKQTSVIQICNYGFNRSYAGMHATAYGEGTYFARDALYSNEYAARDVDESRYMILSKVLTGRYLVGYKGMKAPIDKNNCKFDSAVNKLSDPSIYVIFNDYQAYPAYVVKYVTY